MLSLIALTTAPETVVDLATLFAGAGRTSSAVLSVQVSGAVKVASNKLVSLVLLLAMVLFSLVVLITFPLLCAFLNGTVNDW